MSKVLIPRERILGKRTFEDLRSREMLKIDAPLVKRIVSTVGGKTPKSASVVYDRERRQWNLDTEADGVAVNVKGVESVLSVINPLAAVHVDETGEVQRRCWFCHGFQTSLSDNRCRQPGNGRIGNDKNGVRRAAP